MDLDRLKQYFMNLYQATPVGQINQATAQAAQAAGAGGTTPLTDAFKERAQTITGDIRNALPAMPEVVNTGIAKTNSFLDTLHDKLFGGLGGRK